MLKRKYQKIIIGAGFILLIIFGLIGLFKRTNKLPFKACTNCNIILIDIDILRADELPCYGYSRNTTPNICNFAKKGMIFNDNYSPSYWTMPSMFSTITSLYPTFHRIQMNYTEALSPKIPTLAETLHKQGYRTIYIGPEDDMLKHNNGGLRGYDLVTQEPIEKVVSELSKSSQPWFVHYYNSDLHAPYLFNEKPQLIDNLPAPKNFPITYLDFSILLNKYLKEHYKEIFKQKAIDEYRAIILGPDKADDISVTTLFNNIRGDKKIMNDYLFDAWVPILNTYLGSFDKNNADNVAYLRMIYDTKLKIIDDKLGALFQELDSEALSKNTITAISSDHGEAFGEHGTFSHEVNHFTELYYTPLIIKAPQFSGKIINETSSNIDIFPTFLDLTGSEKINNQQGKSLVSYMNNENKSLEGFSVSECSEGILLQNKKWLYFLSNEVSEFNKSELYDRKNDPLEKNNVVGKNPELARSLYRQADLFRSYGKIEYKKEEIPISEQIKLDPEKIERLKKEGYF